MVDLMIDEELANRFEVSDISVGSSIMLTFEWRPTSRGAYTLQLIVDPANLIEEIDEANNELTQSYGVALPDLTVAFTTTTTEFVEGKAYTFEVEISNIGEEEADDFSLTLGASGIIIESGQVRWVSFAIGSSEIARLPTGSSESVDFIWEPEIAGAYTLVARADPSELVLEGDRTNNDVKLQIEVEERRSLWPYLLVGVVVATSVLGLLFMVRPETFDFLTKYFQRLRTRLFKNVGVPVPF